MVCLQNMKTGEDIVGAEREINFKRRDIFKDKNLNHALQDDSNVAINNRLKIDFANL